MHRRTEARGDKRYLVRFGVTALLLVSGTLLLVLYVLPERYVLESGFRESGMSFPTPTTPFVPVPVVQVAARPVPQPSATTLPGPAQIFWEDVDPLLDEQRYAEAVEAFQSYLREHPGDLDARREYAIALLAMNRDQAAVSELRRLLESADDFDRRLLLARTLRDLGRVGEASDEYRRLAAARPEDVDLWLEWSRAHSWVEEYDQAAAVLAEALDRHPDSVPLRIELARVEFSRDGLDAAGALLADISEDDLAADDALELRDAVVAALTVPDPPVIPEPEPTLLELAAQAREADDFERAGDLFAEALRSAPDDVEIWQAYADFLEYELADFEGAHAALLEVERIGPDGAPLQYRLAQLEIWTGRNDEAEARLLALLPAVEADPDGSTPVTAADLHAMLADLERWKGDRVAAAHEYELALAADPGNQRAQDGLSVLDAEVARLLVEVEQPRVAATSYGLADTDDFQRLDLGGEWVEVDGDWRWGGGVGNRWLDGRSLVGTPAEVQQGVYVDLEAARWWRWGTLRSAAQFGAQHVREDWDFSLGGSLTHRATDGSQTDVRYEHGPAYPVTATLQSAVVGVVQDHVTVTHARRLATRWSVTATADGALLGADLDSIPSATGESTVRLQSAVSLGREMTASVTLGLSGRAVGYTDAAPVVSDPVTLTDRHLFWDPRVALSVGPFVRLSHELSSAWRVTGSLGPGLAFIDERTAEGWDVVPHVAAEAGVRREGARFWTSLDLFFYQGQFDGYRMYGARLTFSARDFSSLMAPG